jgi:hypothetical protein
MMKAMWRLFKVLGFKCEEAETTELGDDLVFRSSTELKCLVSKEDPVEEKAPPPGGRDRNYSSRLRQLENQGTEENIRYRGQSKKAIHIKSI